MSDHFFESLADLLAVIGHREYEKLSQTVIDIPVKFNWVRDVFEPFIVAQHAHHNMLELVTAEKQLSSVTYGEGIIKCNQLLNFLRSQNVQRGNSVFVMCGLNEGLWITYLSSIKGGFILIPAASILTVDDIIYRFKKCSPKVVIADKENLNKMEQALSQFDSVVEIKLLLDGEQEGWSSFSLIGEEPPEAIAADTSKNDDLFWFFTSGTTGLQKVVAHTHASYPLGHLTTAAWIGLTPGDKHYNISQPGWAKFAWSSVFAPLNMGATVFVYKTPGRFAASEQLKIIQDYKITTLCAPPTALRLLIQEDLRSYH